MDTEIISLALQSINDRLSQDPKNKKLILDKLRFLRQFPEITMPHLNEFKSLDFRNFNEKYSCDFFHAWCCIDIWSIHLREYNNFHVSLIGNRIVEIHNISAKYSEMNPKNFYYIGVVFGPQVCYVKYDWITNERKNRFIREIQTTYSDWFHFPDAESLFITKSLVGIEDACPICGGDEDLDKCVMVRGGRCDHAFHRRCIEHWFSHRGMRICPTCRANHDKN